MQVWDFILSELKKQSKLVLLYVLSSEGSSPGREGFAMAVNDEGVFEGTIGGGIMEVKMIELAKSRLAKKEETIIIKEQHHDKLQARNQSGLICSGKQTILLVPISKKDTSKIEHIVSRKKEITLIVDAKKGISISKKRIDEDSIQNKPDHIKILIKIPHPKTIHIFGAGHVGLALAQQMRLLNYSVFQYDDRPELPTLHKNIFANRLRIIDYEQLPDCIDFNPNDAVVIVSFSYRSDKTILKKLYKEHFAYIGMMGSDHKIATLRNELESEGIMANDIEHVFTPIGLNMYSKTAAEIAVSIAAQIIFERNKTLPTGRRY